MKAALRICCCEAERGVQAAFAAFGEGRACNAWLCLRRKRGGNMMGQGFGSAIASSAATTFAIALALAFFLGVLAGVFVPEIWQVIKMAVHAATA